MADPKRSIDALLAAGLLGCGAVGGVAFVTAIPAILTGRFEAAGLLLLAAAVAFGMLAQAVLRR